MSTVLPPSLGLIYFSGVSWNVRLNSWLNTVSGNFLRANVDSIRRVLADPRTSARVVINIRPDALMAFLEEGSYRNIYESPEIGGKRKKPGPKAARRGRESRRGTRILFWGRSHGRCRDTLLR